MKDSMNGQDSEDSKVKMNAENLEKLGRFLDAGKIPATYRSIRYVVDDVYYCVDEDGWWCFEDEPQRAGWIKCDPPKGLQEML